MYQPYFFFQGNGSVKTKARVDKINMIGGGSKSLDSFAPLKKGSILASFFKHAIFELSQKSYFVALNM